MANPRRSSLSLAIPNNSEPNSNPFQTQSNLSRKLSYFKQCFKKPQSFPLLLSIFLFLTWLILRLQHSSSSSSSNLQHQFTKPISKNDDKDTNLIRFKSGSFPSDIFKDKRGWILNPVSLALQSGIQGGAVSCVSVHVGEIRPGAIRGNHRHYTCNETFVIWGAKTLFRMENKKIEDKGYAEVIIGADEVGVAASPSGIAHLLANVDPVLTTFFLGCQDGEINYNGTTADFNVWKDF